MRTWLVILLLLGIGTAGAMRFWRNRDPVPDSNSTQVGQRSGDEDVAPSPAPIDESGSGGGGAESENAAGSSIDPGTNGGLSVVEASPPSAVKVDDLPGGAATPAEGEARRKAMALVEQAMKATNAVEQARLLTEAIRGSALDRAVDEKAYADLLEANKRGLLNPRTDDLCFRVEIKKDDNLWLICRRVEKEGHGGVTPGLLRLLNGLNGDRIYPGAKLKVPSSPVSVVVEKSKFRLTVFVGDVMLRRYQVGLGKDNKTPEGEFKIKTRLPDPKWFKPGVGELPPEHPENILGTRWLGFAEKEGFAEASTFGIHGTRDDSSIGTESSNGCVRMHNKDVEELFEWIGEGVAVAIRP